MFAISFDLDYHETQALHPKGLPQAYKEIERTLGRFGFHRIQQSVYMNDADDLAALWAAMDSLRSLPWMPRSVKDIRAFRVEHRSDFTSLFKGRVR